MSNQISYFIESLEDLPESLHEHYTKSDDGFVLNVAGVAPKKKLDEFRDNNKKLQEELDRLKFVDLDEYKNLKAAAESDSTKGLVQEHDVEELVGKRVNEMRDTHQKEVNKLSKQLEKSNSQLETLLIDNSVTHTATKHRVKEGAIDDVLLRAKKVFRVENGEVIAYDNVGEKAYGKNGEALSINDWIGDLEKNAGHLFQDSTGAGTQGNKPSFSAPTTQASGVDLITQGLQQRRG
jgi:hypothetical protein